MELLGGHLPPGSRPSAGSGSCIHLNSNLSDQNFMLHFEWLRVGLLLRGKTHA